VRQGDAGARYEEHLMSEPVRDELRIGIDRRREKEVLCGA